MSYCRFAWDNSDVYVYGGSNGIVCCGCSLTPDRWPETEDPLEMVGHLLEHRRAGHTVPQYAIDELRDEAGRWGWWWIPFMLRVWCVRGQRMLCRRLGHKSPTPCPGMNHILECRRCRAFLGVAKCALAEKEADGG